MLRSVAATLQSLGSDRTRLSCPMLVCHGVARNDVTLPDRKDMQGWIDTRSLLADRMLELM